MVRRVHGEIVFDVRQRGVDKGRDVVLVVGAAGAANELTIAALRFKNTLRWKTGFDELVVDVGGDGEIIAALQQRFQIIVKRQRRRVEEHGLDMAAKIAPALTRQPALVAERLIIAVHALRPKRRIIALERALVGKADACRCRKSGAGTNEHVVACGERVIEFMDRIHGEASLEKFQKLHGLYFPAIDFYGTILRAISAIIFSAPSVSGWSARSRAISSARASSVW